MDGGSTEGAGGGSFAILGGLEGWRAPWRIVLWSVALLGSLLLNATLLVAFVRRPGLRTMSNRFVMNLIASNLLTTLVRGGLLITDGCGISNLPLSVCAILEAATIFITTSSIFSVLLIGIDQYLAVVDPLRYRTRIDKFRCFILIVTAWFLAVSFAFVAGLNPQPRSLWHLCSSNDSGNNYGQSVDPTKLRIQASLVLNSNATNRADLEIEGEISFRSNEGPYDASMNISNFAHTRETFLTAVDNVQTYGMVYALVYAIMGYFLPFVAICWIYVRIYTAARSNSERTRRTGSRPILSTGSFSEEIITNNHHCYHHHHHHNHYHHHGHDSAEIEEFRRIVKISSLSAIDENSEASPSHIMSAVRSQSSDNVNYHQEDLDDNDSVNSSRRPSAVIFTLGTAKVDSTTDEDDKLGQVKIDDSNTKESTESKVPIAVLKAKFLSETIVSMNQSVEAQQNDVRSKFPEITDHRRKSSHDLMYEEMMLGTEKTPYEYEDENLESSSDEEDERHDYEEVLPLSTTEAFATTPADDNCHPHNSIRSISVNFDLGENDHNDQGLIIPNNTKINNGQIDDNLDESIQPSNTPIVTITPPGQKLENNAMLQKQLSMKHNQHSYITNLRHKISNGSLFKYREETRAARISAGVIVMGLICWTPYVGILLLRNFGQDQKYLNLDDIALGFLILATYISPVLFGYRSRRVKRELRKFFCFKRELSYKNNRSLMAKKVLRRRHSGATILGQFGGDSTANGLDHHSKYNIFNCVYGRNRWPKEKVQFVQVPETALAVETCRSSFSSGASTQISSTSTDEC